MNNTCPSPGCGAVYNLTPAHVGRSFSCKKCNAQLTVTPSGLELSGPPQGLPDFSPTGGGSIGGGERYADEPVPTRRGRSGGGGPNPLAKFIDPLIRDPFVWVVGFGLFLMVLFLFLPLIDQAKVDKLAARYNRAFRKAQRDGKKDPTAFSKWQDGEGTTLMDEYTDAKDSSRTWLYIYRWGMMFSFIIVGAGGIVFLTHETVTRRVVGSVLVCAQVVLIVLAFVLASMGVSAGTETPIGQGGGGGGAGFVNDGDPPGDPLIQ